MVPRGGGAPSDPALRWERGGWGATPADVSGVELKLGALGALLSSPLLFGFLPLWVVRRAGGMSLHPERQRRWMSLASCFAGGVFLATCLLDLLPDYLEGMTQAFNTAGLKSKFPLPEFIMAMGFFLVLVLEQLVLAFQEPERAPASEEHRSLLVDSGVQSRASNGRRHSPPHHQGEAEGGGGGLSRVDVTPRSALRAFVLVFSLSLHSALEGLAAGLLEDGAQVPGVCGALLIHKGIVSFSLSLKLVQARLRRPAVAGCVLLLAATSPLGIGLGLALTATRASPQHLLARSTLEGMAAGAFAYITFLEVLPHGLSSARDRLPRVGMLLLGFAVVTGVLLVRL